MREVWFTIAVGLLAGNASAGEYCDALSQQQRFGVAISLQQRFEHAEIVVLAKVTESTFPAYPYTTAKDRVLAFNGTATLVVTKSWKGPYVPGAAIKAGPPAGFASGVWDPHPVQVGDEVLVFASMPRPIFPEQRFSSLFTDLTGQALVWLDYCSVTDAAHSGERLAFLGSLTKAKSSSP
jgi:hypothetical protein